MIRYCSSLCLLLSLLSSASFSQETGGHRRFQGGLSLEAVVPVNEPLTDLYKIGYGANLSGIFELSARWQISGSAGLLKFAKQRYEDEYMVYSVPPISSIPLRIGLIFHIDPIFYAQIETGKAFFIDPGSGNTFIINPAIGIRYRSFTASLKYEHWLGSSVMQFAGLRVGYYF